MRPIQRLARGRSKSFTEPNFWSRPDLLSFSSRGGRDERLDHSFEGYVQGAYKRNGIVFACILARLLVFSEARFLYQDLVDGRPGDMHGGAGLELLERPWLNGTTGELLARMEQDASLAGNFYATTAAKGTRIRRLRPDWVTIVTGSPSDDPFDIDAHVIGYLYQPRGGMVGPTKPVLLTTDQVVHWSPIPDPEAQWRGMSWITPVVREVEADSAATKHKAKFFQNGATANVVITYDSTIDKDKFDFFVEKFREQHDGVDNAYKTIHLGGGADAKVVGGDLKQLDFKITQGAGETRIAAASGVGAVVAQLSEGMQGSALTTGNYEAAKRRFADGLLRPNWRSAAAALEKFTKPADGQRLWYFDGDVAFLKEDQKNASEILGRNAQTIADLVKEGFTWESSKAAVVAGDLRLLQHTGLVSVQLHAPGTEPAPPEAGPQPGPTNA